jgi:hypothetical protein
MMKMVGNLDVLASVVCVAYVGSQGCCVCAFAMVVFHNGMRGYLYWSLDSFPLINRSSVFSSILAKMAAHEMERRNRGQPGGGRTPTISAGSLAAGGHRERGRCVHAAKTSGGSWDSCVLVEFGSALNRRSQIYNFGYGSICSTPKKLWRAGAPFLY